MRTIARMFTSITKKYLPDAYIFALLLTLVVFVAGIVFMGHGPVAMVKFWGDGFWNLMNFAMQMALILVTGFTLAKTPLISKCLKKIASIPKNNVQAVLMVTFIACSACYINWGFGLIVSGLLALEVSKQLKKVNYGLLIASAYSGFLVWHGGISGSIPLKLTDPRDSIKAIIGSDFIGIEHTLYSNLNIILVVTTVATLLGLNAWMAKDDENIRVVEIEKEAVVDKDETPNTFAAKVENSIVLNFIIVFLFLAYLVQHFINGGGIGLNMVIFIFLGLSIALHARPKRLLNAFNQSVDGASGIFLQFPFYAGIMGMMSASGLATALSELFISFSNQDTFLFFSYISAGVVNFFVPSGGGQWALQAPIILPAAKALGVDFANASMAIAWGDAVTNMVQPFWALPLLAAGKCSLREMMGYCAIIFIGVGLVQSIIFLFIA
ncbi:MAG: short-chain fatty acid transporter [Bacteriovoracaceae bacterium]|nr:short-chain fatty acid transporter [Bacteriovoracaceae bacterium]